MPEATPSSDSNRLTALAALLLISFGLARFAFLPPIALQIPALGLLFSLEVNSRTIMTLLATGVAVAGCDWVLQADPRAGADRLAAWILPGLATLSFGDALARLPLSAAWWAGLVLAGGTILICIWLEFLRLDPAHPRAELVRAGLIGCGFLILAVGLFDMRASGTRAIFLFPLTLVAVSATSGRLLLLEEAAWPGLRYPVALGLTSAELALALHYWPVHPVQFSLLVTMWTYLGVSALRSVRQGTPAWRAGIELGALAGVVLALITLLG